MSRILKIYRQENYVWPKAQIPPSPPIEIVPITFENVSVVETLRSAKLVSVFRTFLTRGRYGIYAIRDGEAVGHAWVTPPSQQKRQRLSGYIRLAPGECAIHYCYVDPNHRGQGIYPAMLHAVTNWALANGARTVRVDTGIGNIPSQRGIVRAGFQRLAPSLSIVLGRHLLLSYSTRGKRARE